MGRDVCKVLDRVIELVPATQSELKTALEHVRRRAPFVAPELSWELWREATLAIGFHVGADAPAWAHPLLAEFLGDNWPTFCEDHGIKGATDGE